MRRTRLLIAGIASLGLLAGAAYAAGGEEHPHPPEEGFTFEGPFGEFEQEQLQRGFQVYSQVCSSCHSMKLLSYRNLGEPGGPFYSADYSANENPQVKAIASQYEVEGGLDEFGDPTFRPATPADRFKSPYANEAAARAANGGAYPPDFSAIVKARAGGAAYIYSLVSGYPEDPEYDGIFEFPLEDAAHADHSEEDGKHEIHGTLTQPLGQYYNPYMPGDVTPQWQGDPRHVPPGGFLAMPPILVEGSVQYMDGTEATVDQMAADVATFLAWASEPKQDMRKRTGLMTVIFLSVLAILLWFSYHQIWRKVDH
ncbi:MAG: cytochrome c1 [Pseudomonadota bacterium]